MSVWASGVWAEGVWASGVWAEDAGGALAAGVAFALRGDERVTLSATEPTGGTAPYTYQWYRSTESGTKGDALEGATDRDHADTGLTNGTEYFYTLDATDDAAATVSYTQVSATPGLPVATGRPRLGGVGYMIRGYR